MSRRVAAVLEPALVPDAVERAASLSRVQALALCLSAGAALALCLPKPGLSALGWVALAPLFYVLSKSAPRRAFVRGWLAGAAFHGVAFYWIYSTCRFGGVPLPISVLAWALLAAFQGLAWGAIGWLGRVVTPRLPAALRALGWAVAWTAVAAACERWTPRLPGDLLEYTQWRYLPLIQIASIAGPHGLGLVVAWVNAALAQAWDDGRSGAAGAPAARGLAASLAAAAAVWVFGVAALAQRPVSGSARRVELLQPDVDQYRKWDERYESDIMAEFAELLTPPAAEAWKPDLVVWPESALPYLVSEDRPLPLSLLPWSGRDRPEQVIGVVSRRGDERYNAALLVGSDGSVKAVYHKRELVPFGEYVPFASVLRPLVGKLNELGGITAGAPEQALLPTPLGPAAATICYEAVFPRWARRDAARGARLIINVTNDGWYKDTWGPYQHFKTNVFRAVENRVTVIRSGNTGISAVIDPWGVETARLDLGARGRLDAEVPAEDSFPAGSFYARHGDWLGTLCMAGAALLLAVAALG